MICKGSKMVSGVIVFAMCLANSSAKDSPLSIGHSYGLGSHKAALDTEDDCSKEYWKKDFIHLRWFCDHLWQYKLCNKPVQFAGFMTIVQGE